VSGVTNSHHETASAIQGIKTLSARHVDRLLKAAYHESVEISEQVMKKYRSEGSYSFRIPFSLFILIFHSILIRFFRLWA
jgi:hypothetical protein